MARFTLPRDIYYGSGAIDELKNLKGYKKAMILTGGSSMKRGGFLQKVEDILHEIGVETQLFEGIEPDPSIETVFKGAAAMRKFLPDVIIAIGGGSPIDAAKAMWVFYEHPEATFEEIKNPFNIPKLRNKAIFVAIPSTSGTATEVTAFSVITDYSTNIKYPLADFEITPDIAILDTDIPLTMPKTLTAHTGMDALTHAIEAYVASARSDFSDPLALIGIAHSLAHKTGAMFDIPHGCCNAILLPSVIQYNAKVCADRYATIARMLGLTGNTDKQLTDAIIDSIKELNKKLGIAQTYKENGVSEELFKQHIDEIAANAVLDPCTGSNPRKIDAEGMKKVLTCAYYGEPVTF